MIRNKKRLIKRMPGGEIKYGDEFLSSLIHDYQKRIEELEYELEMRDTPEHRVCGGYRIVSQEEYDGLKAALKSKDFDINLLGCALDTSNSITADTEAALDLARKMNDVLRSELDNAKPHQSECRYYDAEMVSVLSVSSACSLAGLAENILEDCRGTVPFPAACAVVLKRELDKTKEENRVLKVENADKPKPTSNTNDSPWTPEEGPNGVKIFYLSTSNNGR